MARVPAIVVFNGCFCLVHSGHVQALEDAKRQIEAGGHFSVVAGYFAVAPDGYVRKKVAQMEPWMTATVRAEMCKAVATDRGWAISAAEFAGWKACGQAMVASFHDPSTAVFGVRQEAKKGGITQKGEGVTAELSSSSIRKDFQELGPTSQTVDQLVRRGLLGAAVGEVLKQHLKISTSAEPASSPPATSGRDRLSDGGRRVEHREIRAIYDEETVTVYQAFNQAIAEAAVAANSFRAPMEAGLYKAGRRTWIKLSAVWIPLRLDNV